MSQSYHESRYLRFKPSKCINTIMLYLLVSRVGKHNMELVKKVERMGKIREVERIGRVRRVEEAIGEIR